MDEQQRVEAESAGVGGMGQLKRRGLIAAGAALAAAWLAKLAGPERAQAAHDSTTTYTQLRMPVAYSEIRRLGCPRAQPEPRAATTMRHP